MRFGVHLSFSTAPRRATEIGCRSLQIFCGNPRGWQKSPLDPGFVQKFKADLKESGVDPLVVHATYLINLAAPDEKIHELSRNAFIMELQRSEQLGAKYYVVHAGSHRDAGPAEGRRRIALCVQDAMKKVPNGPQILIENTAGGGNSLGTTFEELAALFEEAKCDRLGLCFDTCHALAAGYEIRTQAGVKETLDKLDKTVGLNRLKCIHLNDSKGDLGSHLDRHEYIGSGCIGEAGFKTFFSDRRLWHLPVILETPQDQPSDDIENLWRAIGIATTSGATSESESGTRPTLVEAPAKPAKAKKPPVEKGAGAKSSAKPVASNSATTKKKRSSK